MYAPLAELAAVTLVSPEARVHRMGRVSAATHSDAVLCQPMRFAMGFMTSTDNRVARAVHSLISWARARSDMSAWAAAWVLPIRRKGYALRLQP